MSDFKYLLIVLQDGAERAVSHTGVRVVLVVGLVVAIVWIMRGTRAWGDGTD